MSRKIGSRVVRWLVVAAMCVLPVQAFANYANVVVVAKSGGDYTDPVAALDSITNASETNPYLLKIMPGRYVLEASRLHLKSYVDIEGSGEGVTIIEGTTSSQYGWDYDGVVVGDSNTSNTEIRDISIEAKPANGNSAVISNRSGSFRLSNVTLIASEGTRYNNIYVSQGIGESVKFLHATMIASGPGSSYAMDIGVGNQATGNKMIINESTISVSAGISAAGIRGWGSSNLSNYEINNTTITVNGFSESKGALMQGNGSLTIKGGTITAVSYPTPSSTDYAISFASGFVGIANTQLISNNEISSGNVHAKCIGLYDANFSSVTCP